ncbi:MAG: site-specific integrase [Calditrichaeota bacterium]|nr:site-specific integrase [Calditrichota bacterium]
MSAQASQVKIKDTKIFVLDQGAHRQLLHAKHPDHEVDLRTRAIYLLQRVTAMRISEALALDLGQVWDGHDVSNYVALKAHQTKFKRNGRNLSLLDKYRQAHTALRNYIRFREKSGGAIDMHGPLFVSVEGKRLDRTAAHRALRRWAMAAGLPVGKEGGITTHTARHTKLSEAVNKGDIGLAVAIAGHADPRTLTDRYLHVDLAKMHDHNKAQTL